MEDYGRRDWELPCVCGHLGKDHQAGSLGMRSKHITHLCQLCKAFHDFKLDNLSYVEQVARAKGLV